jgi:hypothetical protein
MEDELRDTTVSGRSRGRLIWRSVAILLAFGAPVAWWLWVRQQNGALAERLSVGMSRSDVANVFGRQSDCGTNVGAARLEFFIDRHFPPSGGCERVAPQYREPSELPSMYSAVVVAYDRSGRLSAYAHLGEGYAVTKAGRTGQWFNDVPLSTLE